MSYHRTTLPEGAPSQVLPAPRDDQRVARVRENAPSGDEARGEALHPPGPDKIAAMAARLVELGGYDILDAALRQKGLTLATYMADHDYHVVSGASYPDCPACMAALYPK